VSEPAAAYFDQLHASLRVGVPETSGYPALANLLNAVGDSLKPKISSIIHWETGKFDCRKIETSPNFSYYCGSSSL